MRPLFIILLLCAPAQSQKQPASDKKNSQEQIQKPAATQPVSKLEQDQAKSVPIESQVSTNTHEKHDGKQGVKEINETLLVVFNGFLVGVGVLQWLVLRKHEEWMQKHDAHLEELTKSSKDSTEVSQKTLVASFRPKVIVRSIVLSAPEKIRYTVVNQGSTRAHIMSSNITVTDITSVNGWLPANAPYGQADNTLGKISLDPGDYMEGSITLEAGIIQQIKSDRESKRLGSSNPGSVHCLGYIQYMDGNGAVRYTAFCRVFNVQRERFVPVIDSDYEYAD
jgi:hypothetical protein